MAHIVCFSQKESLCRVHKPRVGCKKNAITLTRVQCSIPPFFWGRWQTKHTGNDSDGIDGQMESAIYDDQRPVPVFTVSQSSRQEQQGQQTTFDKPPDGRLSPADRRFIDFIRRLHWRAGGLSYFSSEKDRRVVLKYLHVQHITHNIDVVFTIILHFWE